MPIRTWLVTTAPDVRLTSVVGSEPTPNCRRARNICGGCGLEQTSGGLFAEALLLPPVAATRFAEYDARGDALELPDDGRARGCVAGDGPADLVGKGATAASDRDVQAVKRPAVRGEARRCRRLVLEPAGEGRRAVYRREEPDPGARSHAAVVADHVFLDPIG